MDVSGRATRIRLFDLKSPQMRAFHLSWFAFFLCFFAWFGIAPLMSVVRDEMNFSKAQVGWTIIGSVSITVFARLIIGWLCDRFGPRLTYAWLLVLGSLPVMALGLAWNFESFLILRVMIGVIGASFVITQYHTSVMFAPNCVGTANATTAGWGNMGGGVTQMAMPWVFALFTGVIGVGAAMGWRFSMVVAGLMCMGTGVAYYFLTQDAPEGNYKELRDKGKIPEAKHTKGSFVMACKDPRVWALFIIYAACFGVELTINNVAALYFTDYFDMGLATAGTAAALFGLMNLFARTCGGIMGDKFAAKWGLKGRVSWLFLALFGEGIALMCFSQMPILLLAIPMLIVFSLFCQMAEGATYSVVPFVNKQALGSVAGIVGAGGNAGAVAAGFLFKGELPWPTALLVLGAIVLGVSFLAFAVRFSPAVEREVHEDLQAQLANARVEPAT